MRPTHVAILKANQGEREALKYLTDMTARKVLPLFEVGRITDAIKERKYMKASATPVSTYLNRVLDAVAKTWSRPAMIDGYQWPADSQVESGEHVIAYMVQRLRAGGVQVVPVVGYDRWGNANYQMGLQAIPAPKDGHYCIRLDSSAFEDAAEPQLLENTIQDIIEALELHPFQCSVLLDLADISMGASSIDLLVEKATDVIHKLQDFGFGYYVVAGCSVPKTIDLAVSTHDTVGVILRKEMVLWQTLRTNFPDLAIVSGDYGVRGPTTTEAPSKYTNGKIRHTIKKQTLVVRGHPFRTDGSFAQMYGLAASVVGSPDFLGASFSWGDGEILLCSNQQALGGTTRWIAIDTNHHLTFVVQEVEEFERVLVAHMEDA